jgi:hypothetical protein
VRVFCFRGGVSHNRQGSDTPGVPLTDEVCISPSDAVPLCLDTEPVLTRPPPPPCGVARQAIVSRQDQDIKAIEHSAQRKLTETNTILHQSVKQLESTQRLLHVMRQGKAEAEEQKWQLQTEIQDMQQAGKAPTQHTLLIVLWHG